MNYFIYLLYSERLAKFYIGHAANPWERLEQHLKNDGRTFTGAAKDWDLKAVFLVSDKKSDAMRMEQFIKKQKSRKLLEKLIDPDFVPEGRLEKLVRVPHMRD